MMKLSKILQFDFEIELVSGGRVGGSGGQMEIGGDVDPNLTVLRDPASGEPYIPGSSLKGKLRSEAERRYGIRYAKPEKQQGMPCTCGSLECRICPLFGAHMNTEAPSAPTRIIVRDSRFTKKYRELHDQLAKEGKDDVEYKTENIIERWKGVAKHPRTGERVLAGARFQARILVHVYDTDVTKEKDRAKEFQETIEAALGQMEHAGAIGASGSRGYGEVKIHNAKVRELEPKDLKVAFQTA
jgi:CRISPR-associated protein Csm3